MADARCRFLKMAGLALLGCILAQDAAGAGGASNVNRCVAIAESMSLGAALPHVRAKLRQGQSLTIVALGSSSTTGFGTLGPSFPEVLKAEPGAANRELFPMDEATAALSRAWAG